MEQLELLHDDLSTAVNFIMPDTKGKQRDLADVRQVLVIAKEEIALNINPEQIKQDLVWVRNKILSIIQ